MSGQIFRPYGRMSWIKKPRLIAAVIATALVGTIAAVLVNAASATYYVDPIAGLDTNDGTTTASAFKTIQKALDVASPGTTINLAAGTYTGALTTKTDGTADNPITIQGPETGKDISGRYKAIVNNKVSGRILNVNHSYYTFRGFTIDGQAAINRSEYPTNFSQTRSFKDSVQSRVVDGRLIYIGSADTTRDLTGVKIDDMFLQGAGGECVRMRNRATNNSVTNSTIQWCGMYGKGDDIDQYKYHNAEAVYIGTSPKSTTQPMYANDTSNNNVVSNNTIHTYGSECFEVKENAHNNTFDHNICKYNDEPTSFSGSNIELRGDHNTIESNTISGSRGSNLKLSSDSTSYDKGGNAARRNNFADSAAAAISNKHNSATVGEFCGNTFNSPNGQVSGNSVGDPTRACITPDTQAPTVTITSPANNSTVSGTITIRADATDNAGVTKVDFLVNGTIIGTSTAAPYQQSWTVPSTAGTHQITANAYDAAGNVGTSQVTVTKGADTIPPSPPSDLTGQAQSTASVALSWTAATDNVAAVSYDVYRNNAKVGNTAGLTYTDSGLTANTTYSYYVKTVDSAGNQSVATPTVNVTTPMAPTISFEAESGTITSPMAISSSSSAQGGKFVSQSSGSGTGKVTYNFSVATAGTYKMQWRVIAPTTSSNSFKYAFDTATSQTWSLPTATSWIWTTTGPTVSLTAGSHKLTVYKNENGTRLDAIKLALETASPAPTAIDATKLFEAEAGTASGGLTFRSDSTASGGKYLHAGSSGTATYSISVPSSGTYMIAGWAKAANSSSDSVNVKLDSGSYISWDLQDPTSQWTYDATNNPKFTLAAGTHTLTLQYREPNASVDRLILVKQ